MQNATSDTQALPDTTVSVRDVFGIDVDMRVPAFSRTDEHVPDSDRDYLFDRDTDDFLRPLRPESDEVPGPDPSRPGRIRVIRAGSETSGPDAGCPGRIRVVLPAVADVRACVSACVRLRARARDRARA